MNGAALKPMTLEDFLIWEDAQDQRHEFVDGRVVAMAGGTQRHDVVRGAIYAALLQQLRGKACRPLLDVKLVCPSNRSRYPDVLVDCGPFNPDSAAVSQATVVVEVLSPKTRATDYLEKPRDYGSVPSVDVYLIADPDAPRIDVLRRADAGLELAEQAVGLDAVIELPGLGVSLALAAIYPASAA